MDRSSARSPLARIGDFVLEELVEDGAYLAVFRARHPAFERSLLLKTRKPDAPAKPAVRAALERERDAVRRVQHPLLPALVASSSGPDGDPVLVYLDAGGTRLDRVLGQGGRLEAAAALALGVEIARALGALHQAGFVHGALRAQCVELSPSGSIVVHGFTGLRPGHDLGEEEGLPSSSELAPEQVIGEPPTPASDVFCLGTLVYRLLTGVGPFDAAGGSVAHRIRHEPPPPMRPRAPGLGGEAERVVSRCLRKQARDRYADANLVAEALGAALRARDPAMPELHIRRALGAAGLADAPALPHLAPGRDRQSASRATLFAGGALLAVLAVALVLWAALAEPSPPATDPTLGVLKRSARLRVLARPWAEVHIDGQLVETTPLARPIELGPGRHTVTFRHPNAPDEIRPIEVIAGQSLLLEVDMRVDRPAAAASAAASADEASP